MALVRLDHAIRSAARLKYFDCSKEATNYAISTTAIPRMVPSTLWTKPLMFRLNPMRTILIGNVFGKARSIRCPEVVVTVCLDPLKSDPCSILLTRTLMDSRRLLSKSAQRLATFIKGARRVITDATPLSKVHIGPVKGVLQAAADICKRVNVGKSEIVLVPHYGPDCNLLGDIKAHLKNFLRESCRQAIWKRLAEQM